MAATDHWQERGHATVVLKAPWGLAGRSLLRITEPAGDVAASKQAAWIERILTEQGALVVEPWLDRVADFSVHYDVAPGSPPKLRGMVRLYNDSGGRFIACTAARMFSRLLPPEAARI